MTNGLQKYDHATPESSSSTAAEKRRERNKRYYAARKTNNRKNPHNSQRLLHRLPSSFAPNVIAITNTPITQAQPPNDEIIMTHNDLTRVTTNTNEASWDEMTVATYATNQHDSHSRSPYSTNFN